MSSQVILLLLVAGFWWYGFQGVAMLIKQPPSLTNPYALTKLTLDNNIQAKSHNTDTFGSSNQYLGGSKTFVGTTTQCPRNRKTSESIQYLGNKMTFKDNTHVESRIMFESSNKHSINMKTFEGRKRMFEGIAQYHPMKKIEGSHRYPESNITFGRIHTRIKRSQTKSAGLFKNNITKRLSPLSEGEEVSLTALLKWIVKRELLDCSLLLAYDSHYTNSQVLKELISLTNPKQVVFVRESGDLEGVLWKARQCRGYIFLFHMPTHLLTFAARHDDLWDFHGRYVMVGSSKDQLHALASSRKATNTEQLLFISKGWRDGEWSVYTNALYSDEGNKLVLVSTWRKSAFTNTPIFTDKLSDLRGAQLKVVTFEFEPSVLYYRNSSGVLQFPFGIDIEVVRALSTVLNFSVVFEEPPGGELWGVETENGTWNGMVGKLARGEADIGVANLFLTLGRQGAVDYSAPYDAEVSCFLVRSEPPVARWLSLALPFHLVTWLSLLLGLLLAAFLLFCFSSAGAKCDGDRRCILTPSLASLYSFAMHFREPQDRWPRQSSARLFISFLWLYTIIITTAYSSNLTAFLTVTRLPPGIETVRALYTSGMEVAGLGSFFKGALASAVDPYLQGLGERFVAYQDLGIVWEGVKAGQTAYLHNRQFLEFVITTQFTSLKGRSTMRIMKECFAPYSIAMALQRHSPLKGRFDKVIRSMLESGLVRRWFLESLRLSRKVKKKNTSGDEGKSNQMSSEDDGNRESGFIPLGIGHMQGLFFILLFGHILSLFIFISERSYEGIKEQVPFVLDVEDEDN